MKQFFVIAAGCAALAATAAAFEGRITAHLIQGNETNTLRYTVGPDQLRIENVATNWPHAINIVDLQSGAVTLVFPHNRSFLQLKTNAAGPELPGSAAAAAPPIPPSAGMPAMAMPDLMAETFDLAGTGHKTNLLGFACARYEQKQRGETLEVWATDKLLPFQPYMRNRPPRFGPRLIEEQWPGALQERKLFPLLVSLHSDNGAERLRFEVTSVKEEPIADPDRQLFQPPTDYHELPSLLSP